MNSKFDEIILSYVRKNAIVPEDVLSRLIRNNASSDKSVLGLLVKENLVNETSIIKNLSSDLGLPYLEINSIKIDKRLSEVIPYKFAWHYRFVPVSIEGRLLTIALIYPLDIKTQDELRLHFGYEIKMVMANESDVLEQINALYGLGADVAGAITSDESMSENIKLDTASKEEISDIDKLADDKSIVRLVNQIILEAYKKRATDIHIEPCRGEFNVRYRIDGVLYDTSLSSQIKPYLKPVLSRIKIMANLNIVERRLPQDGRAVVKVQNEVLDLRVSFIPTVYGESLVIRILPSQMTFDLGKLGLSSSDIKTFENLISKPHGIIFVTGPTGSGKTTTLYTCLSRIDKKEKKIVTIEDPVEYEIPGLVQIQVSSEIGLTFAKGLRSILRHDPDVIMIGEVRDLETAEIAMRSALTGHLVFSTLHTNDAPSGITRLIDIGVPAFLISSSVDAFIAQRLVRVICPFCKKEDTSNKQKLKLQISKELGIVCPEEIKLYTGSGCESCNFTGFHGRTGIFEILFMDSTMKDAILNKPSSKMLRSLAISEGMRTLRKDGWEKVITGVTTAEEIIKVTEQDYADEPEESFVQPAPLATIETDSLQYDDSHTRRLFPRLPINIPFSWKFYSKEHKFPTQDMPYINTMTKNVGGGGVLFSYHEPLVLGAILDISINISSEININCLSRVVRVEEVEDGISYHIAICFLDLSGADRAKLNRLIIERSKIRT
ncbi:MAG: Flp pilus assembly complex ATPase component TadA [Candidatus Omnitrophica bacterium]|jgi:type II secretory ATPase GspE/PulE/Tfp pilus assembly ATPase PilB-like protein|nr:Flp pilus assembly complex ATPase component TadA [Candidatus Omnitrophota bacterium]